LNRIPDEMLERMAACISEDDRDEMAIPSYLHRNPAMRWMAWRRLEILAGFLERACSVRLSGTRPTVMDFGCGTGVLFETANRFAERIYGVDLVLDAAKILVEERHLERVQLLEPARAAEVIGERSIDIILAAEVLEHIDPLSDTLELFRTRLKPGGLLFISVPTENLLYRAGRSLAGFQGDYHHSNAASIDRKICSSGFEREQLKKIPLPGPLAIYWVAAYRSSG
jgi:2-polyprenyl-3-methyl-5-hydroxy-6-metoxy-1,4-benzoquinol methylase